VPRNLCYTIVANNVTVFLGKCLAISCDFRSLIQSNVLVIDIQDFSPIADPLLVYRFRGYIKPKA